MSLAKLYSDLYDIGAPISNVLPATENTSGALLVNNTWLIQLSTNVENKNKPILLDKLDYMGGINQVFEFKSVDDVIKFIMEN
jgi:hypothetical protein